MFWMTLRRKSIALSRLTTHSHENLQCSESQNRVNAESAGGNIRCTGNKTTLFQPMSAGNSESQHVNMSICQPELVLCVKKEHLNTCAKIPVYVASYIDSSTGMCRA